MQPTIPTAIAAILPLLATMLSSWLSDDKLASGINAAIALLAILLTATACELLAGNFTGNVSASFLAILGYVGVLMAGDFSVLYSYLMARPGPLSTVVAPVPANPNPVRVPVALQMPTAPPARIEAQQGDAPKS